MKLKTIMQNGEITLFWKHKEIRTIRYQNKDTAEFDIIKSCENSIFNKMYDALKQRGKINIQTKEVKSHLLSCNEFYSYLVKWLEKEK